MCPSLTPKSKKERPQESFELINTSNLSNMYSTSLKSFQMDVYNVSSIDSKNGNVSDGKLLPPYVYQLKGREEKGRTFVSPDKDRVLRAQRARLFPRQDF